jgi:nucleoside-diphosphate-sugar epimerase
MRVLVTGAAGTLGTGAVPRFPAAGYRTVAPDVRPGESEAQCVTRTRATDELDSG